MDKKHLFIGHLAQNEGWESREIAVFLDLSPATVDRILEVFRVARIRAREPEVALSEICPSVFHGA
jgi:hypothetical protein